MAVIQFPPINDASIKNDVNHLIEDSLDQSQYLEDIIMRAPHILEGHAIFREILCQIKRGVPMEDAVQEQALDGCPPKDVDVEECTEQKCTECWLEFITNYHKTVVEKKNIH